MIPCDVTTSRTRVYERRQQKGVTSSECEEGLWSFVCSASWIADVPSAIESAVTVMLLANCCLFALLTCSRAIVPVTCAFLCICV
ncbi:hypothetical protein AVEN_261901-1 [Araneus ventricosus]|uniref:Uncharacterized protein n=1 Tax=Araneus ventricosus TaxID=182803 RepID=A0A4Y2X9F0_ARAVE|nr:hypothetical protein AVEN_261901-1 [Araneus ventricosus]